ncbi:MAG TPA: hypothetical protein VJ718_07720 [Candidatus Binataceae bacterium]|nr:hypothetical protein [Candidatus Binataceae bacterium]
MAEDGASESSKSDKWVNVCRMIADSGAQSAPPRAKIVEPVQKLQSVEVVFSAEQRPDGAIAQFRASQIGRTAALRHVRTWYEGQLEAARHAVEQAIRVRKAEASRVAERLLMQIDSEHVQHLLALGLRSSEARNRVMLELGDQTSRTLKEIEDHDWAPQLVQEAICGVLEGHRRFFARIRQELGEK